MELMRTKGRGYQHELHGLFCPKKHTTCVMYLDEIGMLGVDSDDFQFIGPTSQ